MNRFAELSLLLLIPLLLQPASVRAQTEEEEEAEEELREFEEFQDRDPNGPRFYPEVEFRKPRSTPGRSRRGVLAVTEPQFPLGPQAPAARDAFIGLEYNQAIPGSQQFYPPDTMGAVGIDQIVVVTNTEIRYLNRSGVEIANSRRTLDSWWNLTSGGTFITDFTSGFAFDVKIFFDRRAGTSGRFIFTCLAGPAHSSNQIMLAVSKSSNPSDGWWGYHADFNGADTRWMDYPGLGIGSQWIVVTGAKFAVSGNCGVTTPDSPYCGTLYYQFDKANALNGTFAPPAPSEFAANTAGGNNILLPTVALDGSGGADDIFFVQSGWETVASPKTRMIDVYKLTSGGTFSELGKVDVTNSTMTYPTAPQLGSVARIETGDDRMVSAVLRNGRIWAAHTVGYPTGAGPQTQTQIAWYAFGTGGAFQQGGLIRDTVGSNFYWFPSISVDEFDNVGIGFSGSGSGQLAGAYYTGCYRGGTTCTMDTPLLYKAGESTYNVLVGGKNRWGDYSATVADSQVIGNFWTIQERASQTTNQYETHVARFSMFPSPASAPPSFASTLSGAATAGAQQIQITWGADTLATNFAITKDLFGCTTVITTVAYNATLSYTAAGLNPNETVALCVRSENPNGSGSFASISTTTVAQEVSGVTLGKTATSITANFTPPPAAFAQGYQAEAFAGAACTGTPTKIVVVNDSAQSFVDIPGLQPTTTYCVRVAALNARGNLNYGAGIAGQNATTDTNLVVPAPAAPTNVTDVSIRANWGSGGNATGTLYSATASVTGDFSGAIITSTTYNLFATFSGLTPNTTYFFKVAPASAAAKVTDLTAVATLAQAPQNLAFKAGDPTTSSATLTFGKAGNPNPGTTYFLELDGDASFPDPIQLNVCGGFIPCSNLGITGLPSNTEIFFRLRARNHAGVLTDAVSIGGATLPHAPINPQYVSVTFSSATVQWTISPCSTCTRQGWRLEAGTAAGNFNPPLAVVTDGTPSTNRLGVGGLSHNTDFLFRIGAIGVTGRVNYTNFAFATHTALAIFSSNTITSTGAVISFTPTYPQLTNVALTVPQGALPAGAVVRVDSSVQYILGPQKSNQGKIFALGPTVAVDITTDGGIQPLVPTPLRFTYNPAQIPAGFSARDLHVCWFDAGPQVWDILPSRVDLGNNTVEADLPHFSLFAPFFVAAGTDLSGVEIFPVPWEPGTGGVFDAPGVTFANMPPSAEVRVYTLRGELVWEGTADGSGLLRWDGRTRKGQTAASGVYLAHIVAGGQRLLRRVVITR
ncbi:MAG: hypothetical protein HY925_09075 [Elusimicrobia bacterium]|nr:hypothetical protein [Elusimicrobiota bacterium]